MTSAARAARCRHALTSTTSTARSSYALASAARAARSSYTLASTTSTTRCSYALTSATRATRCRYALASATSTASATYIRAAIGSHACAASTTSATDAARWRCASCCIGLTHCGASALLKGAGVAHVARCVASSERTLWMAVRIVITANTVVHMTIMWMMMMRCAERAWIVVVVPIAVIPV